MEMEIVGNESQEGDQSVHVPQYNQGSCCYCPNCYNLMNEVRQLRMELAQLKQNDKKVKKNFNIAPTLYTFFRNGLAKRHLAR